LKKVLILTILNLIILSAPSYAFIGEIISIWNATKNTISENEFYIKSLESLKSLKDLVKKYDEEKANADRVDRFFKDIARDPAGYAENVALNEIEYFLPGASIMADMARDNNVSEQRVRAILSKDFNAPLSRAYLSRAESFYWDNYIEPYKTSSVPWGRWVVANTEKEPQRRYGFLSNLKDKVNKSEEMISDEKRMHKIAIDNTDRKARSIYSAWLAKKEAAAGADGAASIIKGLEDVTDATDRIGEKLEANTAAIKAAERKKAEEKAQESFKIEMGALLLQFQHKVAKEPDYNVNGHDVKGADKLRYWGEYVKTIFFRDKSRRKDIMRILYPNITEDLNSGAYEKLIAEFRPKFEEVHRKKYISFMGYTFNDETKLEEAAVQHAKDIVDELLTHDDFTYKSKLTSK
jgi:hypothetical protein